MHGKQQPYPNHRQQFLPLIPPNKPGVYKPIVTPLMLPMNPNLFERTYLPAWDLEYDWDTVYRPFNEYYVDNIALFNSHQVICIIISYTFTRRLHILFLFYIICIIFYSKTKLITKRKEQTNKLLHIFTNNFVRTILFLNF